MAWPRLHPQAALIAGFAFTCISELSLPAGTPRGVRVAFMVAMALVFACELHTMIVATMPVPVPPRQQSLQAAAGTHAHAHGVSVPPYFPPLSIAIGSVTAWSSFTRT